MLDRKEKMTPIHRTASASSNSEPTQDIGRYKTTWGQQRRARTEHFRPISEWRVDGRNCLLSLGLLLRCLRWSTEETMNSIGYIVLLWESNYGCEAAAGNLYSPTAAASRVALFGSNKQTRAAFLYCERTLPVVFSAACAGLLKASFKGRTAAGHFIQTGCGPNDCVDGPKEFCVFLRNVEVGQVGTDGHTHSLSLTNLRFPSDEPGAAAFTVSWGAMKIPLRLSPRRNYSERVRQLAKKEDVMPTAILHFRAPNLNCNATEHFITDLCLALSLVQGKKINWIYHATYRPRRSFQHAVFGETVCKADTAQPLCFNPAMRTRETPALTASKDALSRVKHFRETYDPNNRLINAWLDARTETDYLEARTLKYVVVIETLNALTVSVANI
jgi:hypothetical protein